MRKYEVVEACYVPVGPGLKYKKPGQVVTLDDPDAGDLAGFVVPVGGVPTPPRRTAPRRKASKAKGVQKSNTPKTKGDTPKVKSEIFAKAEEVDSDVGEPGEVASRAGGEAQ